MSSRDLQKKRVGNNCSRLFSSPLFLPHLPQGICGFYTALRTPGSALSLLELGWTLSQGSGRGEPELYNVVASSPSQISHEASCLRPSPLPYRKQIKSRGFLHLSPFSLSCFLAFTWGKRAQYIHAGIVSS